MNALARSLLITAATILALGVLSLAAGPVSAGPATTVVASKGPIVANPAEKGQPEFDPYVLRSPYEYMTHNCPPENCGTVDQCGDLPAGTPCGTQPGCTCKKCHNWGICRR